MAEYGDLFGRLRRQSRPFGTAQEFTSMASQARQPLSPFEPQQNNAIGGSTTQQPGGLFSRLTNRVASPPPPQDPYGGEFGLFFKMLDDAKASGTFDPEGKGLMELIRQRATADAGGLERGAVLRAQSAGLSPESVNFARFQGGLEGQSNLAGQLGEAGLANKLKYDDFVRGLLASLYGSKWAPKPQEQKRGFTLGVGPVSATF